MRNLTEEEQKRFDVGVKFCKSMGVPPMDKETFIRIADSFNAMDNLKEQKPEMVRIVMDKKSFDKLQEYINRCNLETELMSDEIKLADKVTDMITGFTGIVVSLHTQIDGETTAEVQPICKKNMGFLPKAERFNIDRLEKK